MKVLSHRGYWREPHEKNGRAAFERSFKLRLGTETDVRDACGELVISHDMPRGGEMTLNEFLSIYNAHRPKEGLPLALNIKADGMAAAVKAALDAASIEEAFVFDMSVPDARAYFEQGIPVFARMSEVERYPAWLERCSGVWLDAFEGQWYGTWVIADVLARGKKVCVVSPELHKRPHLCLWAELRELARKDDLYICTDFPEQAVQFFNGDGVSG